MKAFFKNLWCWIAHRRYLTWKSSGDWYIYHCSKCDEKWPEPKLGYNPRGKRASSS